MMASSTARPAPTVIAALEQAAGFPERGHIYFDSEAGHQEILNYERLCEESCVGARKLAGAGVVAGARVVLSLAQPREFVLNFLAVLRLGAVAVPVVPLAGAGIPSRGAVVRSIVAASGASHAVCDGPFAPTLRALLGSLGDECTVLVPEELAQCTCGALPYSTPVPDDIAFLQFTSGSTGDPKGVIITHRCLMEHAWRLGQHGVAFDRSADMTVSWLPLHHDMGLIGFLVAPLAAGVSSTFVATERFVRRPWIWFDALERCRGTITFAPNFGFALMVRRLRHGVGRSWDLSSLRIVGCGGEPIMPEVLDEFVGAFGRFWGDEKNVVLPCYGMAEATLAVTFGRAGARHRVDEIDAQALAQNGTATPASHCGAHRRRRVVGCGHVLPDDQLRIVAADGLEVPERTEGEIHFRGRSVTPGYFRNQVETSRVFRDGWLHTGDLGYVADGELFVSGRKKDVIICNGVKHHASDIESAAIQAGARVGGVVAIPASTFATEQVALVMEGASGCHVLHDRVARRVECDLGLTVAQVISVPVGRLPRTTSGKLRREAVRRWYAVGAAGGEVLHE